MNVCPGEHKSWNCRRGESRRSEKGEERRGREEKEGQNDGKRTMKEEEEELLPRLKNLRILTSLLCVFIYVISVPTSNVAFVSNAILHAKHVLFDVTKVCPDVHLVAFGRSGVNWPRSAVSGLVWTGQIVGIQTQTGLKIDSFYDALHGLHKKN